MRNQLEIVSTKVDWLKIIKLALSKKDWGKSYTLYTYGDCRIVAEMVQYNFREDYAEFEIKCIYPEDNFTNSWANFRSVNYHLKNYSIDDFKRLIIRVIDDMIKYIIKSRIRGMAESEYSEINFEGEDIDEEFKEKYGFDSEYSSLEYIENEEIKRALEGTLDEKLLEAANEEYNDKVDEYIETHKQENKDLEKLAKYIEAERKEMHK